MSKTEKIIRAIILCVAELLLLFCVSILIHKLDLDNDALKTFIVVATAISIGLLCGNSINNTLNLPDKKD